MNDESWEAYRLYVLKTIEKNSGQIASHELQLADLKIHLNNIENTTNQIKVTIDSNVIEFRDFIASEKEIREGNKNILIKFAVEFFKILVTSIIAIIAYTSSGLINFIQSKLM